MPGLPAPFRLSNRFSFRGAAGKLCPVLKWLKFTVAVLLLPACAGAVVALGRVFQASAGADTTWVPLAGGAVCWIGAYLLLPKPMLVYVFGHELTHALWALAMGSRVKKFKASSRGGHVVISRCNFLIALAPYFFPLYAMLVAAAYGLLLAINVRLYPAVFHLLLGAAYAFHLTLTGHILGSRQTDITEQGYLFSGVVIFLGNATVLLLSVPLLTARVSAADALRWWAEAVVSMAARAAQMLGRSSLLA